MEWNCSNARGAAQQNNVEKKDKRKKRKWKNFGALERTNAVKQWQRRPKSPENAGASEKPDGERGGCGPAGCDQTRRRQVAGWNKTWRADAGGAMWRPCAYYRSNAWPGRQQTQTALIAGNYAVNARACKLSAQRPGAGRNMECRNPNAEQPIAY